MKKRFIIDGRFLTSMSTGVDRYAYQIIRELDKYMTGVDIVLYAPSTVRKEVVEGLQLKNVRYIQSKFATAWTQGVFALKARSSKRIPINLCNEVSVLAPRGITALHDVCYAEDNDFFPADEKRWFLKIYRRIRNKCRRIITVSDFSRERIEKLLRIKGKKITVAGNGWQHLEKIEVIPDILDFYEGLSDGNFYFNLGSANANKNIQWVLDNAEYMQSIGSESKYVVAGKDLDKKYDFSKYSNVEYIGYADDVTIKSLMSKCKAFLFPSFYEGFGIPPLEAASVGANLIVSDRASLPEICMDCANYIDPTEPKINLDELCERKTAPKSKMLEKYSWDKSAKIIADLICQL